MARNSDPRPDEKRSDEEREGWKTASNESATSGDWPLMMPASSLTLESGSTPLTSIISALEATTAETAAGLTIDATVAAAVAAAKEAAVAVAGEGLDFDRRKVMFVSAMIVDDAAVR